MQGHDVGVLDLLQDVHLPLDLLSFHAASAGTALPLLDELGGVFDARASVLTAFDDGKLPAEKNAGGNKNSSGHWHKSSASTVTNESYLANHRGDIFHHLKYRF